MFAFMVCPLAALLFVVRLVVSPFSPKVSEQMRKHPVVHLIWGCFAFVGTLVFLRVLNPAMWPPRSVERREQRQKILERVQKVGGWDAVRLGCEALITNYPDGLTWFPPASNAWVYPNPQTKPHRYYVTNLDWGTLPPAVAALQPIEIRYYPPRFLPKDEPQFAVVRIKIFGLHSTGGHSIPYFGLEVVCGTNAESYRPQPARGGVSGNHYDSYDQVADRIYEIY
jgi:hypothetical protein